MVNGWAAMRSDTGMVLMAVTLTVIAVGYFAFVLVALLRMSAV